ncbi:QcrA Rieske Fe-S protein [Candidatus Nanopelagicaceae bacterium]
MSLVPRRVLGLGFLYSLITMVVPAFAATKPSVKCRFVGQTATHDGKLFTCIKVKVKGKTTLTWDSGKVIPVPAKSAPVAPTPVPTPTQSVAPVVINKIEIPVGKSSEVPANGSKIFTAKNRYGNTSGYVVIRNSTGIIALSDICPHKGCSVEIQREGLVCPCHNALFDSKSGDVLRGPASYPLEQVPVREADGIIYITD